jgi:hypothetical protein
MLLELLQIINRQATAIQEVETNSRLRIAQETVGRSTYFASLAKKLQ